VTLSTSDHEGSLDEDLEMGSSSNPDQNEAAESSADAPPPPALFDICEDDFGVLNLPRKHYPRAVPNVCAICLDSYKPDETVIWSSNIDCSHAFHQDCILDYFLVKLKVKDTVPCPCCRQDFMGLSSPPEADENGATNSDHTEELNAVAADATPDMASEENV
jgi:hypothetical protein